MIALLTTVVLSCHQSTNRSKEEAQTPAKIIDESLNGIVRTMAQGEIDTFKNSYWKKNHLERMDFWIDINVIKDIVKLLHDEKKIQDTLGAKHKVDGIRIYFVPDKTNGMSLVMVTTVDSSIVINPLTHDTLRYHHDYYLHADTEAIFKDKNVCGIPTKYENRKKGARLYSGDINGADNGCATTIDGGVSTVMASDAVTMVNGFCGNKDSTINTKAVWYGTGVFERVLKEGKGCDGIRIYFARHLSTERNNPNRDTFLMTTTEKDSTDSTNHNDYFYCKTITAIDKHGKTTKTKIVYMKLPPFDNGGLCPNNCN